MIIKPLYRLSSVCSETNFYILKDIIVLNTDFSFSGTTAIIWVYGNLFVGIEIDFYTITGN